MTRFQGFSIAGLVFSLIVLSGAILEGMWS